MSTVYVVLWEDLAAGLRAAQACHAAIALCHRYPVAVNIFAVSRVVVVAANATELHAIGQQARFYDYPHAAWSEDDCGGALTALALTEHGAALVKHLPLG